MYLFAPPEILQQMPIVRVAGSDLDDGCVVHAGQVGGRGQVHGGAEEDEAELPAASADGRQVGVGQLQMGLGTRKKKFLKAMSCK